MEHPAFRRPGVPDLVQPRCAGGRPACGHAQLHLRELLHRHRGLCEHLRRPICGGQAFRTCGPRRVAGDLLRHGGGGIPDRADAPRGDPLPMGRARSRDPFARDGLLPHFVPGGAHDRGARPGGVLHGPRQDDGGDVGKFRLDRPEYRSGLRLDLRKLGLSRVGDRGRGRGDRGCPLLDLDLLFRAVCASQVSQDLQHAERMAPRSRPLRPPGALWCAQRRAVHARDTRLLHVYPAGRPIG